MKIKYSAQDQRRINELGARVKEISLNPDLRNMKELKGIDIELTEIRNKYPENKKVSPLLNLFLKF